MTSASRSLRRISVVARRRQHDAGAERLRQYQRVARVRAGLCDHLPWMHESGDGEPILRLHVVQRVAAGDDAACLGHLAGAAFEDLPKDRRIEIFREGGDVQRH